MNHFMASKLMASLATGSLCLLISACGADAPEPVVKIFKFDQSKQCERTGITPEDMRNELIAGGIDVLCAQKSHDGRMRAAVCGGGTGAINVYLIRSAKLADATALGYAPVTDLAGYQDEVCVAASASP